MIWSVHRKGEGGAVKVWGREEKGVSYSPALLLLLAKETSKKDKSSSPLVPRCSLSFPSVERKPELLPPTPSRLALRPMKRSSLP